MAQSHRISQQFRPETYNLKLQIDQQARSVDGQVEILGSRRSKPSYRITLHQAGLKITWAKVFLLTKTGQQEIEVSRLVHHQKFQELRIHTNQKVESGKYRIELAYRTRLNNRQPIGLYLSSWHDSEDKVQELTASQFQPHYARTVFPCIDEPEAKAVFNLSLIQLKQESLERQTVLFNTPIISSQVKADQLITDFKPTPLMSTYLLALVIGELGVASTQTKRGLPVSVYATPNKIEHAQFALKFAAEVLDLLEEYFGVSYPLGKCDLVAVPDFESGGMENWGLITFREDLLLFDEQLSTLSDKQAIALTIAHEVAHQWFGNLVTMKWWDELWLNEGFANFMEFFVVDKLFPEWKVFEEYLVSERSSAIRLDSLPSSKAIIKQVVSPSQALECFDEIAYEKSGSIVRMLHGLLGEEAFKMGLKDYFLKHQYKSASSEDLIKAWQAYSKVDLQQFVKSWLYQPGLPVLEVTPGDRHGLIVLSQQRFLSEKSSKLKLEKHLIAELNKKPNLPKLQKSFYRNHLIKAFNYPEEIGLWQIPVNFVADQSNIKPFILKKPTYLLQLSSSQEPPLKLNQAGVGFYLTSYSVEFLAPISLAIRNDALSDVDTLNLLSDFISLNKAGQFKPGARAILDLIYSARNSQNTHFWALVGGFLANINHHLRQTDQQNLLYSYTESLLDPPKQAFGLNFDESDKESDNVTGARFEVLSLGVLAYDKQIHTQLLKSFDQNQAELTNIHPEQRILALYCAAKRGQAKDYELMARLYRDNAEDVSLREDLMYGLTSFEGASYTVRNLALFQNDELVRAQDVLSWLSLMIGSSLSSKEEVLKFILKEGGWGWLQGSLTQFDLSSAVRIILTSAYTTAELNTLKRFFVSQDNTELDKALSEAVDMAKSRITWSKSELPAVVEYLTSFHKK